MPIPLFILNRIQTAPMTGPQIADAFIKLAQTADRADLNHCAINIEYVGDQDTLLPGNLIPMITLSLVRQQEPQRPAKNATDNKRLEIRPRSQQVMEMPGPFFQPAEAACDVDPYPEE